MADGTGQEVRKRGPEVFTLIVGILALGMATSAFVGQVPTLAGLDARWLLAAGAAAVGLLLLIGSLRGRRR
ncbi:hypothetical protein [Pseudonocardia kunmingensis]|uniref:Uncharacterized protein n=1 Tax=Pseudonocardia kunmingensis TaxID=630975 RepID=A0A543E1L2_9PSEU|nr:hypothetical protein [Pseudonocardia kunmingensis]TQM15349.1 hypothetical protein FB558_2133 [Pseudonocardia kunmingensis]